MRLKSIKLAGFKSFVDPTTITFPHNLSAIVGPNGCGKSNVIDAVRWVMGESSAKHLRGESMADVIFNGSNSRKPLGQCSIELVFDNTSGRVVGEYGGYNEIAIKRQVSRDGQSVYFLNSTRCRRKDITDIFLGTGLGPRSYAIIEQGMISRLIEAKPEELRVFIEEAAGISKYKERRRDTENRIRRTRENLERLTDLRDELERQLNKLKQQSAAAIKYKELKEQERQHTAQLQAMRWKELDLSLSEKAAFIRDLELKLEACLTDRVSADSQIEQLRTQQSEASDRVNVAQSEYYSHGTEIAKVEQNIQHQKERQQQLQDDLSQIKVSRAQAQEHLELDQDKIETLQEQLLTDEPELALLSERSETSTEQLAILEERLQAWQMAWETFSEQAQENSQKGQLQQTKIQHLEKANERLIERIERLENERAAFNTGPLQDELEILQEQLSEQQLEHESVQQRADDLIDAIAQQRDQNNHLSEALHKQRAELQQLRGRESSLQALQQAALGRQDGQEGEWLEGQRLGEAARLAEKIQLVDAETTERWSKAVETVLGDYLQAVCLEQGLEALSGGLAAFDKGQLTLLDEQVDAAASAHAGDRTSSATALNALAPLTQWVTAPSAVQPLLVGIYAAVETEGMTGLDVALSQRAHLQPHESIVTQEGIWVGPNWLRISKEHDAQSGVLQRQQDLEQVEKRIEQVEAQEGEYTEQLEEAREALRDLEAERESMQQSLQQATRAQSDIQSQISAKQARLEQMSMRAERIETEIRECSEHREDETQQAKEARAELQEAMDAMADDEGRRNELTEQREQNREELEEARLQAQHDKESAHTLTLSVQTARTQLESLQSGLMRLNSRLEELQERETELLEKSLDTGSPVDDLADELEHMLKKRLRLEAALTEAREGLEGIESQLRTQEKRRDESDRSSQSIRINLESERLQNQEKQVKRDAFKELLDEGEYNIEELLGALPAEATPAMWEEALERIGKRVSRLGAINLAAIDEYEQQKERKEYLDTQNADLEEALETLETAIRKIDKETRERFKETFEKVNNGLKALFPKVFGGGSAYLELTGEDLLDTGVAIMARPPGKKNSTIHLLSGGEKALTAVALVFSIFQLNPAPFCMLDEVDAPLDDANVGRYSRLLKEMSDQVQFIYITHNKIAMEISDQLMGVTMHEPGVSRLVSVDVDEAAALAAI